MVVVLGTVVGAFAAASRLVDAEGRIGLAIGWLARPDLESATS